MNIYFINPFSYHVFIIIDTYNSFVAKNKIYFTEHHLFNHDGTLYKNKINEYIQNLERLARICSFTNKLYVMPKEYSITSSMYEILR